MNESTIAVVGNPNCGKTTLFNALTGGHVKTGNWPGVTVEKREGKMTGSDDPVRIVDLPGIYSFSAHAEDEKIAREYILSGEPSLIINILDATNLERNLYLTTQLIEMKVPLIIVLNMMDLAKKGNVTVKTKELSQKLGVPVVAISAIQKNDIDQVKKEIQRQLGAPVIPDTHVSYPNEMEGIISGWQPLLAPVARELTVDARWIAIKLLENDQWTRERVQAKGAISENEIRAKQNKIETILDDTADIICADYRYGFIKGITQTTVKRAAQRQSVSEKIDKIALNRFLGIPLFLAAMYFMFWLTITVGGSFIDFFDGFFGTIFVDGFSVLLENISAPDWLIGILAGGIGTGIQTVATFVPIIFMMFLLISILEDSGYMARAAFVMDRLLNKIGLPGKSFIPMLVGFGCTVPAIMGTRTLENKRDRMLTIFMTPFMSCGARLPVYALFVAAFFQSRGGLIVFSLYMVGILFAVLTGLLLKNTLFRGEQSYFIMELPPYHLPRVKHVMMHTWGRLKAFVMRAGYVIIIAVTVLSILNSWGTDGSFGHEDSEKSVLAKIGRGITPVFTPMGVEQKNWPATVGLFTGLFAKEAVVGTLNSLYGQIALHEKQAAKIHTGDTAAQPEAKTEPAEPAFDFWGGIKESFATIPEALAGVAGGLIDPFGLGLLQTDDQKELAGEIGADEPVFGIMGRYFTGGPPQAYAYLLFVLLYFPCLAAFGAVVQEAGKFLGILNAVYLTVLAWSVATLFYQITLGHQLIWIVIPLVMIGAGVAVLYTLGRTRQFRDFPAE
jgi:ferrous iron transport protein B